MPIADIFAVVNACGRWYITCEMVDLVWRNEYEKIHDLQYSVRFDNRFPRWMRRDS
jgi:hypothetical protein